MTTFLISSPIGCLQLSLHQEKLTCLRFLPDEKPLNITLEKNAQKIVDELTSYFENPKHPFAVALEVQGTPFQKSVWAALERIPCGQVLSYQALAEQLKTSARAVGNACRANPVPLIVPCHRVVAKKSMGGFCGETGGKMLAIKNWLLAHEQKVN